MPVPVTWPGTAAEFGRLVKAIEDNCTCVRGENGGVTSECSGHKMLTDQNLLNHLVFIDKNITHYLHDEWKKQPRQRKP